MRFVAQRPGWDKLAGFALVVMLHAAALMALWHYQIRMTPQEAVTLFVDFINPPAPAKPETPPAPRPHPKPAVTPPSEPPPLAVEAPVVMPQEPVAPPPPEPVIDAPPSPPQPVQLATELSVTCPARVPPAYPPLSRRLGEEGRVVLRVELDEQGRVSAASIETSSGTKRLDDAALSAVKSWRCTPALHDGAPARAVALQPFVFVLKGR